MIEIKGKSFCFTGKFETQSKNSDDLLTRNQVSKLVEDKGGIVKKSVIKSLDYLVVGGLGSNLYSAGTKGQKIMKAEEQENTRILSEDEFFEAINY
jgi:NAD-dependent DNA ligase